MQFLLPSLLALSTYILHIFEAALSPFLCACVCVSPLPEEQYTSLKGVGIKSHNPQLQFLNFVRAKQFLQNVILTFLYVGLLTFYGALVFGTFVKPQGW